MSFGSVETPSANVYTLCAAAGKLNADAGSVRFRILFIAVDMMTRHSGGASKKSEASMGTVLLGCVQPPLDTIAA